MIENNFVKSRIFQEPLYGLNERVWSFTIGKCIVIFSHFESLLLLLYIFFLKNFQIGHDGDKPSDSVIGRVRLTPEGTKHFESLKDDDKRRKEFYEKLREELAIAIPADLERITTTERVEIDTSIPSDFPKQIFLSINIEKPKKDKTEQERSADLLLKDLDSLIRHKPVTPIAFGENSRYLDQDYGYKPLRKNSFLNFHMRTVFKRIVFKREEFQLNILFDILNL